MPRSLKKISSNYFAHWREAEKRIYYLRRKKQEYLRKTFEFNCLEAHIEIPDPDTEGFNINHHHSSY